MIHPKSYLSKMRSGAPTCSGERLIVSRNQPMISFMSAVNLPEPSHSFVASMEKDPHRGLLDGGYGRAVSALLPVPSECVWGVDAIVIPASGLVNADATRSLPAPLHVLASINHLWQSG